MNYRQTVRELALDQYGCVTTRDAADAGVPAAELRKLRVGVPRRVRAALPEFIAGTC